MTYICVLQKVEIVSAVLSEDLNSLAVVMKQTTNEDTEFTLYTVSVWKENNRCKPKGSNTLFSHSQTIL